MYALDRTAEKPRLLCRFGFHAWFRDSCEIFSADRCDYCPAFKNEAEGKKLDFARWLISDEYIEGEDFVLTIDRAARRLATETPP